jgi:hypothetical protein
MSANWLICCAPRNKQLVDCGQLTLRYLTHNQTNNLLPLINNLLFILKINNNKLAAQKVAKGKKSMPARAVKGITSPTHY